MQMTMCDLERAELGSKFKLKQNSWLKKKKEKIRKNKVLQLKCSGVTVVNFTASPKIFWMLTS